MKITVITHLIPSTKCVLHLEKAWAGAKRVIRAIMQAMDSQHPL